MVIIIIVKELFFNRLCSLLISVNLVSLLKALNNYLPIETSQWTFQVMYVGEVMTGSAGGGGVGVGISQCTTFLGKVEQKVLPSFDSLPILFAVFTQQLKILLTAQNIMILKVFLKRI